MTMGLIIFQTTACSSHVLFVARFTKRKGKERKEKKITAITTLVFKQPERKQEEEKEEEKD